MAGRAKVVPELEVPVRRHRRRIRREAGRQRSDLGRNAVAELVRVEEKGFAQECQRTELRRKVPRELIVREHESVLHASKASELRGDASGERILPKNETAGHFCPESDF